MCYQKDCISSRGYLGGNSCGRLRRHERPAMGRNTSTHILVKGRSKLDVLVLLTNKVYLEIIILLVKADFYNTASQNKWSLWPLVVNMTVCLLSVLAQLMLLGITENVEPVHREAQIITT